jgi:16S rRNA (uracil1498-N3)-methyltransferase
VSLRRFFVRPESVEGGRLTFDADEARHIARVLRLTPGDVIAAVDGQGQEFTVRLDRVSGRAAAGTVVSRRHRDTESLLAITLAQGIPKGDRMEAIIRATTELGVARIVPLLTERTVVRLQPGQWRAREARWQRVVREAAKQCGRALVPVVEPPRSLPEVLGEGVVPGLTICLSELAADDLSAVLERTGRSHLRVTLVVGPEGGLTSEEVELATGAGASAAGLGPRVLRTETAGIAAVAILQHRLGDLGESRVLSQK